MTILDGLKNSVAARPDKLASITPSARLTYAQLDERVNRLTRGLAGLEIGRGERVAILALNHHRYLELY